MARARRLRRAGSARAVRRRGMSHSLAGSSAGRAKRVEAPVGGDPVEPPADRGAPLEPSEALPSGQQRVLQGVLGVLEGSEHPVAVHLQLSAVRLGQLPERLAVPGPRPADQVGCHHPHPRVTSLGTGSHVPSSLDTGRGANWAVGARPVSRRRGVWIVDGSDDPDRRERGTRDDAEGQGCGDLRSRRRDRRRRRTRLCARGGQALSHRPPAGVRRRLSPRRSSPPADPPRRRRWTRSMSRLWTSICSP